MTDFKTNILKLHSDQGKAWLEALPQIMDTMSASYGLSKLKPLENLSYHYVLSGFKNHQAIVLKLGLNEKDLEQEAAALQAFEGFGAVRLLEQRPDTLLLERAIPGISLKSYFPAREDEAIQIACTLIQKLHQAPLPKTGLFPTVWDWLAILDQDWDIPMHYLEKARKLRTQLLETAHKMVLLHGDLHHDNILQQRHDWVMIDPKGVMGEPIYEVAAFIRNPIPELMASHDAMNIIENRIHAFSDILGLNRQRIRDWCFVQAVLAWVWTLEDGNDDRYFGKLTELFNTGT